MPRKCELTWQPGINGRQGRWRKKYKGRTVYLGLAQSKSDLEAYRESLALWKERKAEIDAEDAAQPDPLQADYDQVVHEWEQALQWSVEHNDDTTATAARLKLADLYSRLERKRLPPLQRRDHFFNCLERFDPDVLRKIAEIAIGPRPTNPDGNQRTILRPSEQHILEIDGSPDRIQKEIWKDRLKNLPDSAEAEDQTLGGCIDRYLSREQERVEAGQLSAGRFTSKRNNLHDFRKWFGQGTAVTAISSERLLNYRNDLLKRVGLGELARDTAHGRMTDVSSFVRKLWMTEKLPELPRILAHKSKELSIGTKIPTPEFFTVEEIKKCLKMATERTRLYLLLMLNLGAYQGDISDIRHDEVDWKAGTITRRRSKTKGHGNAPIVRYKLWRETFQLLKKHRTTEGDRVLLSSRGNPLVDRSIKPNGDAILNDAIKNAYNRLRTKTGIQKPLKLLRKTSANLIASHEKYRGLEDLFLGHSPSRMSERHYTASPDDLLAEAVVWLGGQYGVK